MTIVILLKPDKGPESSYKVEFETRQGNTVSAILKRRSDTLRAATGLIDTHLRAELEKAYDIKNGNEEVEL